MKTLIKSFILLFVLTSSLNIVAQDNKISETDLLNCWTDSREENKAGTDENIYRPCDFKTFPPSRFRFKFELKKENKCSWYSLASTDAHHMEQGTWTFNKEKSIIELSKSNGNIVKKYQVIEVQQDILKLKEI